jgi:hypothetical protein
MVFDAAVIYAHNEYELGIWRRKIIKFGSSISCIIVGIFPE